MYCSSMLIPSSDINSGLDPHAGDRALLYVERYVATTVSHLKKRKIDTKAILGEIGRVLLDLLSRIADDSANNGDALVADLSALYCLRNRLLVLLEQDREHLHRAVASDCALPAAPANDNPMQRILSDPGAEAYMKARLDQTMRHLQGRGLDDDLIARALENEVFRLLPADRARPLSTIRAELIEVANLADQVGLLLSRFERSPGCGRQ
jgi:hypothetical protein